jgi:copper chaperone NosL
MLKYATLTALALLVAACTAGAATPRSPHWNKDGCAHCRMAISEPAAAAQLVGSGGLIRHYDDLGCLLANQVAHEELSDAKVFVVAPGTTDTWVAAEQVRFRDGAQTPMGFGILPDPDGKLSFAEVERRLRGHRPAGHH